MGLLHPLSEEPLPRRKLTPEFQLVRVGCGVSLAASNPATEGSGACGSQAAGGCRALGLWEGACTCPLEGHSCRCGLPAWEHLEYKLEFSWMPPKKFLLLSFHSLATLLSGRGKLRELHLGGFFQCLKSIFTNRKSVPLNATAASLARPVPLEKWCWICLAALWLLPPVNNHCQESSQTPQLWRGALSLYWGEWPPIFPHCRR